MCDVQEVPKHKKKSSRKTPRKSKHKHNYTDVLIKGGTKDGGYMITSGKKCTICSKLVYGSFIMSPNEKSGFNTLLMNEGEIVSYYNSIGKNIEIVHVNRWGE